MKTNRLRVVLDTNFIRVIVILLQIHSSLLVSFTLLFALFTPVFEGFVRIAL